MAEVNEAPGRAQSPNTASDFFDGDGVLKFAPTMIPFSSSVIELPSLIGERAQNQSHIFCTLSHTCSRLVPCIGTHGERRQKTPKIQKTLQNKGVPWWAHKGSNLGPIPCEGGALVSERLILQGFLYLRSTEWADFGRKNSLSVLTQPLKLLCAQFRASTHNLSPLPSESDVIAAR